MGNFGKIKENLVVVRVLKLRKSMTKRFGVKNSKTALNLENVNFVIDLFDRSNEMFVDCSKDSISFRPKNSINFVMTNFLQDAFRRKLSCLFYNQNIEKLRINSRRYILFFEKFSVINLIQIFKFKFNRSLMKSFASNND